MRDSGTVVWDERRLRSPHGQPDKAKRVRHMFDRIAPTYELVNRVLSAGRDAAWRREMVRLAQVSSSDRLLDVACGTGDVARAFGGDRNGPELIVGMDFATGMLSEAWPRATRTHRWTQADALRLPFADESFTIATCAFGVRNFEDLSRGLAEMHRVLRPGGRVLILEFSLPRGRLLGSLYGCYFHRVLPFVGSLISRDRTGAYRYLPRSVVSFPDCEAIASRLVEAGFAHVEVHPQTLGIVAIYRAVK